VGRVSRVEPAIERDDSTKGRPPAGTTGLYHVAILYPSRMLADALRRLRDAGIPLDGASDHGVSEALYLRDSDDNGAELYRDRPQQLWPRTPEGGLAMFTRRLELDGLSNEVGPDADAFEVEEGPRYL
jgi:catechol 2,3-dioxygenase